MDRERTNVNIPMQHSLRIAFVGLILAACATSKATIDTYRDPGYQNTDVRSLAILPLRSEHVAPPEAQGLTRLLADSMGHDDPSLRLVSPSEAVRLMNQHELTDRYVAFLRDYSQTGVPEAEFLRDLGEVLDAQAIMLGHIVSLSQQDGSSTFLGGSKGTTRISVRFIMFDRGGEVLWEALGDGLRRSARNGDEAPPVSEAVQLAMGKIIANRPTLPRGESPR